LEAGQQIRDYILEEKIGAGGAGEVWRARHQYLDKVVAIKAIYRHSSQDVHFGARFLEEASVMAKLSHPHIVPVHDFFFLDGISYLVMDYIEGGSLGDLIKERGHLPLDEALTISLGILEALNFAHSRGVIHRDVKPSNILVRPDKHAYLVDFGIALVVGKQRHTRFGTNIGTPEYMSPEQILAKEIDHRTDVYSFGCVLYEMLTGRPPFGSQDTGKTEYNIMNGHLHEKPVPVRQINRDIDQYTESAVLRALAKDPDQRYGGCQEFAGDLKTGRRNDEVPGIGEKGKKPANLAQLLKYLGILFLIAVLAVIFVPKIIGIFKYPTAERMILEKVHAGQLVLPIGESAYDLWKDYIRNEGGYRHLQIQPEILAQLKSRGDKIFSNQQDMSSPTEQEWLEASRTYEWVIHLQVPATVNGKTSTDVSVEELCSNLQENMKQVCARYSYSVAQIDFRNDRLEKSMQNFERAVFYDKDMCTAYVGIGEIYIKQGKYANAEAPFLRSVNCDQSLCSGHFARAKLFQRRSQLNPVLQHDAIQSFREAIKCSPKNGDFVFTFEKAYEGWGQYCNAVKVFRDFLGETKKDPQYQSLVDYVEQYVNGMEKQYTCY
jgi:serine/threonine protein kinase